MICDDMIVGAACMAHSAVEGGQARSIVRPERRRGGSRGAKESRGGVSKRSNDHETGSSVRKRGR